MKNIDSKKEKAPKQKKYASYQQRPRKKVAKKFRHAGGGHSNCFTISGKHTKSGMPILSNDPHFLAQLPSTFHISKLYREPGSV